MGIALFTFGRLLAPLRSLTDWLVHTPNARRSTPQGQQPATHCAAIRACPSWLGMPGCSRARPRRPLRVVRLVEASPAPAGAGRMFISGRMADVCAELDRLAALEAAAR